MDFKSFYHKIKTHPSKSLQGRRQSAGIDVEVDKELGDQRQKMGMLKGTNSTDYTANNLDSFPEIEAIIKNEDYSCPAQSDSEGVGVILQADSADSIDIKYEFPELTPSLTKKRRGRPPSSKKVSKPGPSASSRKRQKDSSNKPSIATAARKSLPFPTKLLKEPVSPTSSSLPLTKPGPVKITRLRLNTASNITKGPSVIPCNLLATLPLIHNYLEMEDLINSRLVCKVWKRSVDNYLARKRRMCPSTSNTSISEPVPSTSPTKTCTVKPLIREEVKEEIINGNGIYKATFCVGDIGTDEEVEVVEIKYQPPDESQLNTEPQENLESVPDSKTFLEALPLFISYFDKDSTKCIKKCRLVCRSWRDAVKNYITTTFLKASLSDLQKKTKVSSFLQKFTDISAWDNFPKMENHKKNPFIGHTVHLHLPNEWALRLVIPKFLKRFGQHIWTLHIDGEWGSSELGPLITDDVLLHAPNIKNFIISKSSCLGSLEVNASGKHPFEFLERVEISEVSDLVKKSLLKRLSETQLKILCLDSLEGFVQLKWPTLKEVHLKDFRLKDDLSIINAPHLELLELGLNMECWSSGKYQYSIFGKILNGLQSIRSLNAIRFSFYSSPSTLWINQQKRSSIAFSELQKCPENIKTVEIYNACFRVKSSIYQNYSEGFEFADYSFLLCFAHVENLKIIQERIPTQFLSKAVRLNDTVKVHQLIYAGKMYESNIWEKMPTLQELTFGKKIYKRSSFMRNPKLRIGTQAIQQAGAEPGASQNVRPYYRTLRQNVVPTRRPRQRAMKSTGGLPRYSNESYPIAGVTPQQARNSPWY